LPNIFEFFSHCIHHIFSDVSTSFLTSFFTVTTGSKVHVAVKQHQFILIKKILTFLVLFPPGGFCPPFFNSPSHAPNPHIFSTFFTLPFSGYPPPDDRHAPSTNRGDQPSARRLTWPTFFTTLSTSPSPSPLHHEAVEPNLHRHPYTIQSPCLPEPGSILNRGDQAMGRRP